jgi:hypothetical protein
VCHVFVCCIDDDDVVLDWDTKLEENENGMEQWKHSSCDQMMMYVPLYHCTVG